MPVVHRFPSTHWSTVIRAGAGNPAALALTCRRYWPALYALARREGARDEDARDLVQGFLERLLSGGLEHADPDRGRLRSLLSISMRRWIKDERVRQRAQRRGGPLLPVPLSDTLEAVLADAGPSPQDAFEHTWALGVVRQAMERVEERCAGQGALFDAISPVLEGEPLPPYAELALRLGRSERTIAVAVCRLRQRFASALRSVVAETVPEHEVDDELRWLVETLRKPKPNPG